MSDDQGDTIEEMFVQLGSGVTCASDSLTLQGVPPSTLYFSDRPDRVVGHFSYAVKVLEGSLPASAWACSLFIDPFGRPLAPESVCGVHRRGRRRQRRQA